MVIDITGVPTIDARVASHFRHTVRAAGLMGVSVIVTWLSPEVAQALGASDIDLGELQTESDLQGGIEAAERILGVRAGTAIGADPGPR